MSYHILLLYVKNQSPKEEKAMMKLTALIFTSFHSKEIWVPCLHACLWGFFLIGMIQESVESILLMYLKAYHMELESAQCKKKKKRV